MTIPTYDFRCTCGHVVERRTPMSVRVVLCPECGLWATRQFTVTDPGRIRITEGFRAVTRSMVVAERPRESYSFSVRPPALGWAGGFGHTKGVPPE